MTLLKKNEINGTITPVRAGDNVIILPFEWCILF